MNHAEWQAKYDLYRAQEDESALAARDHLLGGRPAEAIKAARESVEYGRKAEAMLTQLRESRGGGK